MCHGAMLFFFDISVCLAGSTLFFGADKNEVTADIHQEQYSSGLLLSLLLCRGGGLERLGAAERGGEAR